MERAKAIYKLQKLIGPEFGYRVDASAPTGEARRQAQAEVADAAKDRDAKRTALEQHRQAVLAANDRYNELNAEYQAARKKVQRLECTAHSYKFTVGRRTSLWFSVTAQGDSWEEIIQKVTKA